MKNNNEPTKHPGSDFIDLVVAATVSTIALMGIFAVMTIVDLFI